MKKYKRIFTIVIDSLGIGAMPDSEKYGDVGVNTLLHISESVEKLHRITWISLFVIAPS